MTKIESLVCHALGACLGLFASVGLLAFLAWAQLDMLHYMQSL